MATRTWIGRATKVAQEDTITLAGTWAAGNQIDIDIDTGGVLTLIIGSAALNDIGSDIVYMLTGVGSLASGSTVNGTGNTLGDFRQLQSVTYSTTTNKVTLTGKADGRPFALALVENSASGTAATATATTASGPHDWTVARNWSGDTVPTTGDSIIFDHQSLEDLKYNLVDGTSAIVKIDYSSDCSVNIGLAPINNDDPSMPYYEGQGRFLDVAEGATTCTVNIGVEGSESASMGWMKIDTGNAQAVGTVRKTATRASEAPVEVIDGAGSGTTWTILRGDVDFAVGDAEVATITTLEVGFVSSQLTDAKVNIGNGSTITNLNQSGGAVSTRSTPTTIKLYGGTMHYQDDGGGGTFSVVQDATLHYESSGTLTAGHIFSGGIIDFTRDRRSRTVTAIDLYTGAGYKDPYDTVTLTAGIDLNGLVIDDLSVLEHPRNKKISFAAVS
jgi:hypothetical protein